MITSNEPVANATYGSGASHMSNIRPYLKKLAEECGILPHFVDELLNLLNISKRFDDDVAAYGLLDADESPSANLGTFSDGGNSQSSQNERNKTKLDIFDSEKSIKLKSKDKGSGALSLRDSYNELISIKSNSSSSRITSVEFPAVSINISSAPMNSNFQSNLPLTNATADIAAQWCSSRFNIANKHATYEDRNLGNIQIHQRVKDIDEAIFWKRSCVDAMRASIDLFLNKLDGAFVEEAVFKKHEQEIRVLFDCIRYLSGKEVALFESQITNLEKERGSLLLTYWDAFFKISWPQPGSRIFFANKALASGEKLPETPSRNAGSRGSRPSSPSTQAAAEGLTSLSKRYPDKSSAVKRSRDSSDTESASSDDQPRIKPKAMVAKILFPATSNPKSGDKLQYAATQVPARSLNQVIEALRSNSGPRPEGSTPCTCKKSKCLKRYCECFAAGYLCASCHCESCKNNTVDNPERRKAIEILSKRRDPVSDSAINTIFSQDSNNNPSSHLASPVSAHKGLVSDDYATQAAMSQSGKSTLGCNCRRSNCLKKYCICYGNNIRCGHWCRCLACANGNEQSISGSKVIADMSFRASDDNEQEDSDNSYERDRKKPKQRG